jgi:hypothetical protein
MRKSTGRNRRGISLSIDNDLADRLQELNSRERSDIVNVIFREHLDVYIGKQSGNSIQSAQVAIDERQLRQLIREEVNRIGVTAGAARPINEIDQPVDSNVDTGLIDGFLGMRDK